MLFKVYFPFFSPSTSQDHMCVSVCFCLYSILSNFGGYLPKKDNSVVVLVSVYFSHLFSKPVSRLPIDLVQPVKFYSLHLRRLLFEIHEGLLIRTNCKHQVQSVTLSWPIGLREHEGLISWLIKLSVREASQTNEHWLFFTMEIKMVFYHNCPPVQSKKSYPCGLSLNTWDCWTRFTNEFWNLIPHR